jgi:bifunctional DNA-binding transcriptional regulator/antitoxin component of YhaV-PrlF toxin-antitoxin module
VKAKVTRHGQISLPAELRHRWQSSAVLVIDRGSYAIVRPVPDDVVTALRGAHAGPGPTAEQVREAECTSGQEMSARRPSEPRCTAPGSACAQAPDRHRPIAGHICGPRALRATRSGPGGASHRYDVAWTFLATLSVPRFSVRP